MGGHSGGVELCLEIKEVFGVDFGCYILLDTALKGEKATVDVLLVLRVDTTDPPGDNPLGAWDGCVVGSDGKVGVGVVPPGLGLGLTVRFTVRWGWG